MAVGDELVGLDGTGADYRNRTRTALGQICAASDLFEETDLSAAVLMQAATASALMGISASIDQLREAIVDLLEAE